MFASIEFFVFLIIAGATALFNWLQKRNQEPEDWAGQQPPRPNRTPTPTRSSPPPLPQTQPARKTTDWEEELRRMLEGTAAPPPPPPPVRAPAPVVIQEKRPAEPPPSRPAPPPRPQPTMALPKIFEEKYYKAHCNHCGEHMEFPASSTGEMIICPHCGRPTALEPFTETAVEILSHKPHLSSLSERVAAHMGNSGHHRAPTAPAKVLRTQQVWPEVAETVALFKNAKSVRQAVIASLILGPPKALEN
jgi:hypothetical protein